MPYLALSALTCGVADHLDTSWPATTRTPAFVLSKRAATHASIAVNVTEIDVSFTGIDEVGYEGVGFAERLGGYELVEAELTSVGSAPPVNPAEVRAILRWRRASHTARTCPRNSEGRRST